MIHHVQSRSNVFDANIHFIVAQKNAKEQPSPRMQQMTANAQQYHMQNQQQYGAQQMYYGGDPTAAVATAGMAYGQQVHAEIPGRLVIESFSVRHPITS